MTFFISPIPLLHSFLFQSRLHFLSLRIDLLISVLFCQDHMSEGTLSLAVRPPYSHLLDDNSAVVEGVFSLSRCRSARQLLSAGAESCENLLQRSFFSSCSLSQRESQQTHSHTQSVFHNFSM